MAKYATAREWMRANGAGMDKEAAVTGCMKEMKCRREIALRRYRDEVDVGKPKASIGVTRTIDDFRRQFDVSYKIREGIKTHLDGCYLTDQEFREKCGVHTNNWRRYADSDEFRECRGRFSGNMYWAQPKTMREMKHIAGIPMEV